MLACIQFYVVAGAIALSIIIGLMASMIGSILFGVGFCETNISCERFKSILDTSAVCFSLLGFLFAMFCVSTTSTHNLKVSVNLQLKRLMLPTGRC